MKIKQRVTEDCEYLICGAPYGENTAENDWVHRQICDIWVKAGCIGKKINLK